MPGIPVDTFTGNQVRIIQSTGKPKGDTLAVVDQLLVLLPEQANTAAWKQLPQGSKLSELFKRSKKGNVPAISSRLGNKRQTMIHVATVKADSEAFELLTLARKLFAAVSQEKAGNVGLWVAGFNDAEQEALLNCLVAAGCAAAFPLPTYKSKQAPAIIKSLRIMGADKKLDLRRTLAEARGNNLARALTSMPANKLDADAYCAFLKDLAKDRGWTYKRYGVEELHKKGAGAFLAVAQGNEDDSAAMVRLRYNAPKGRKAADLSLVGKGIIFDTGGTNLKPFNSMLEMHIDMGGSAVAVGTLLCIDLMQLPQSVDCWLAITENRTGPRAYKSQDVVTAANGKTIQTIHTDAEGRMALADALHFASESKPGLMIDYATLTGACMNAVTTRYSGVFTNRPDLHPVLKKAGRASGERVWPFPVDKEFLADLSSETADLKQCSPNGGGDHIMAATFLNEFVNDDVPWVHVDLSACTRKGGLAHIPTTITGFGVRFTMNLLLDQQQSSA